MPKDVTDEQKELVVFSVVRGRSCGACGKELPKGHFLILRDSSPLCMECADLDHLFFLASGSAKLTRRARKYSRISPVVVRWSRSRKRYERRGMPVEQQALERATEECLTGRDQEFARQRSEIWRKNELDPEFAQAFTRRVLELFPGCPPDEAQRIGDHASYRARPRVGRPQGPNDFSDAAVESAVPSAIRHGHTRYGELLVVGWGNDSARAEVEDEVEAVECAWRKEG